MFTVMLREKMLAPLKPELILPEVVDGSKWKRGSPWFVDPLFNTFHPLAEKYPALAADIEKVVQRTGLDIPADHMFLMDASKKTNDVNAYVTGFGASKRIVVWDTTVQKLTTDETMFIFGHEAGHYVLNHIRNGFTFFAAGLLAALFVGYRALNWVLAKWGRSWGIEGPEDWASLAKAVRSSPRY